MGDGGVVGVGVVVVLVVLMMRKGEKHKVG